MASSELNERLAKLILMFASDKDGEVVNAVRAVGRSLEGDGLDFHYLADMVRLSRVGLRPPRAGAGRFNFADEFRESAPPTARPDPGALTSKLGIPLFTRDHVDSWGQVARYCLEENRKIPKAFGGKFLQPWQMSLLGRIQDGAWPKNCEATMLETVVARCHQARDAQRRAGPREQRRRAA